MVDCPAKSVTCRLCNRCGHFQSERSRGRAQNAQMYPLIHSSQDFVIRRRQGRIRIHVSTDK